MAKVENTFGVPKIANLTKLSISNNQKLLSGIAKIFLPLILAGVCLYYILMRFQWTEIWGTLRTVNLGMFLTASILTTILFWFLRTMRWAILVKNENLKLSFFKLYLYTAVTVGFANFTPFQAGEALKVEFLRQHGGNRVSGYNYFFFEKIVDLLVIAILAAFGVWIVFKEFISDYLQSLIIGSTVILAVSVLAFVFGLNNFLKKTLNRRCFKIVPVSCLFSSVLLTVMSWLTILLGWKFIFQSAEINLTISQTAAIISLTTIIGILSFIPGTVGVSEVSIVAMLSQLGYEIITAQTGAIMITIHTLMILILAIIHLITLKTKNIVEKKGYTKVNFRGKFLKSRNNKFFAD